MPKRKKSLKLIYLLIPIVGVVALSTALLFGQDIPVLDPKGTIATQQRDLIIIATLLMLIVIVPVYVLTIVIAWRYRAGNKKAHYTPNWDGSRLLEFIWWGLPFAIIFVLGIIIWKSSHELDPYKPLVREKEAISIQVVSLQWKWLFIYPEQRIASVNFVQFPERTPVNFKITSDAPMNSFWIPNLGGQVYAMSGMSTKLHLMADGVGDYRGVSANISGEGFSEMKFTARSSSQADFEKWIQEIKQSKNKLSIDEYNRLAKPSRDNKVKYYSSTDQDLYDKVIMKYMEPAHNAESEEQTHMEGMEH